MSRVSSSAVERVEYAREAHTLDIWFAGGERYRYFEVLPDTYAALLAASSTGAFVNARIKPFHRFEIDPRRRRFRPR